MPITCMGIQYTHNMHATAMHAVINCVEMYVLQKVEQNGDLVRDKVHLFRCFCAMTKVSQQTTGSIKDSRTGEDCLMP